MSSWFLGQFLVMREVITAQQLVEALEYQKQSNPRLGEYAVSTGAMTRADVERILQMQRSRDVRFGEAAVALNILSEDDIARLLRRQQTEHVYLAEALVKLGFVTQSTMADELVHYRRKQATEIAPSVGVPAGVPMAQEADVLFGIAHRLISRLWGVPCKPGYPQLAAKTLRLPEVCGGITLSGDISAQFFMGAPLPVAEAGAKAFLGFSSNDPAVLSDLVGEMLNVVAGSFIESMAKEGMRCECEPPQIAQSTINLENRQALIIPFRTPESHTVVCAMCAEAGSKP